MDRKNTWKDMSSKELKNLEKVCADYRTFISEAKTERECVDRIVNTIEAAGYKVQWGGTLNVRRTHI